MNSQSVLIVAALACLACAKDKPAAETPPAGTKLGETAGMNVPESVRYDAELDVYFVSNVNGNPSQKDNNGFIARVLADSTSVVTMLVEGGKNGATLNAPKGMAINGDTLFVADITALRMFDRKTGASLGAIELSSQRATFLNDVTVGPDGIYITDTGIKFDEKGGMTHPGTNMIFRVAGGKATVVASGDSLLNPNGITWIAGANGQPGKFLLAPFGGPTIQTWNVGEKVPTTLTMGPGGYDGIEALANGNVLVSSWTDSTLWIAHGGSHMMPLIKNVSAPADIGVDTKRNVVAIPRFNDGKVEYYQLP
jgi:sugar lactone lactonase YvrE